jgi:hypothetical protein
MFSLRVAGWHFASDLVISSFARCPSSIGDIIRMHNSNGGGPHK